MTIQVDPVQYQLWFTEDHTPDLKFSLRVQDVLFTGKSKYQKMDVLQTQEFGRVLVLDGCLMITERDEFVYHEMIVHVPCNIHPKIEDVLVIGGGDGGTIRELLKYRSIRSIELCEIDGEVIEISKRFFPKVASGFNSKRVRVHVKDGVKFVAAKRSAYDLIIVDSTDPTGPGKVLFTRKFYNSVKRALRSDGIMVCQSESPMAYPLVVKDIYSLLAKVFPKRRMMLATIPSYPSGLWSFGVCSLKYDPVADQDVAAWKQAKIKTDYYNADMHQAAFVLPEYAKRLLA